MEFDNHDYITKYLMQMHYLHSNFAHKNSKTQLEL